MVSGYIKNSDTRYICIKINCTQYNVLDSDIELLVVPIEDILHSNLEISKSITTIPFKGDEEVLILYLDLLLLQHDTQPVNRLRFNLLLNKFFEKITLQHKNNQLEIAQIKEIEKHIDAHIHENLKIQDLAKIVGINQQYLKIRFKNTFGITLHEIALKIGYSSLSSFSQAFKQKFGKSPLSYKISNN
jgi:AraC-like DNA-binding protein